MDTATLLLTLLALAIVVFFVGRERAAALRPSGEAGGGLHSLPAHYGHFAAIWCLLPSLFVVIAWLAAEPRVIALLIVQALPDSVGTLSDGEITLLINNVRNLAFGNAVNEDIGAVLRQAADRYIEYEQQSHELISMLAISLAVAGSAFGLTRIRPAFRARTHVERVLRGFLIAASGVAVMTTIGIVLSVLFEAMQFFRQVPVSEFLFGLEWSPQTAIRDDQVGSSGRFGVVPLLAGTILITLIAMIVAVPVGLMSAIFLAEYSTDRMRAVVKPALEILAGIPTVVYGFFAALTVAPWIRRAGETLGLEVASESALAAGLVMGIMIIPLVSSLSDDAINAVPSSMRDGALGLGATRSETMTGVILPAALPGIVGGILLAVSRAIGETMIVVMAAGLAANLTANPFEAVTTVTVQIVTLLVGDQEFDSAKTLAAFALGLLLFLITMVFNVVGLNIVRKYREQYE
jgi:phosphate transport system permease protein